MLRLLTLMAALAVGLVVATHYSRPTAEARPHIDDAPPPRLLVVVYFDQMRGDYLQTWQPLFTERGFHRLQTEGAWFSDCLYPYANTSTGPGHASVLTGCPGSVNGIVNNNWYDRMTGETVYCASTGRYQFVPAPPKTDEKPQTPSTDGKGDVKTTKKPKEVGDPMRLLSPSLGDRLKEVTDGKAKVFGLSLKDRSAIFPSGKKADGAYWFDGRFVTSTYYRERVHPWVAAFNASGATNAFRGKDWVRLRSDIDYAAFSGPDNGPGEGNGSGTQGKVFPHPTGNADTPANKYLEAVVNSPYGNDLLLSLAKQCVRAEGLGRDETPDLLTISFSSNDLIGHAWGPDSQEVLDVTLRSDLIMADLLSFLDREVGVGKYAVMITADHGICPTPESSAAKGRDAKRISPTKLLLGAEKALQDAYGKVETKADPKARNLWLESVSAPYIYLNRKQIDAKGLKLDDVAATLAKWIQEQDGVLRVFTRAQLTADVDPGDEIATLARRSFHPERSGDVMVVLKPYYLLDSLTTGTNHGTPHPYDRHVPLIVYGPGIPGGERTEKVTPLHAATIGASLLKIPPPRDAMYPVPTTLYPK